MADEDLTLPVDGEVIDDPRPDEAQPDPIEELAKKAGWSPKESWRGDESEWKPARDYLERTVDMSRTQRREIKDLTSRIDRLAGSVGTFVDRAVADERSKWEAKHSEAVDLGDRDAALKAADELRRLDTKPNAVDEHVAEFKKRNADWFEIDPLATQMALNAAEIAAKQGKSEAEQVDFAEKTVKARFPELFRDAAPKPPAQVSEPAGRMAAPAMNREKGFADMPPEQKRAALMFEKRGIPKEDFAAQYWKESTK